MAISSCVSEARELAPLVRALGPVSVVGAVAPASAELAGLLSLELRAPLRLVLVQGLGGAETRAPWGAVDEEGSWVVDYFSVAGLRLDEGEMGAAREKGVARLREARCASPQPSLLDSLPAERVLLVQSGIEQGLLLDAAVSQALRHGADEVVVAAPWSTSRAASRFRDREHVSFVCPRIVASPPPEALRGPARPHLAGW